MCDTVIMNSMIFCLSCASALRISELNIVYQIEDDSNSHDDDSNSHDAHTNCYEGFIGNSSSARMR